MCTDEQRKQRRRRKNLDSRYEFVIFMLFSSASSTENTFYGYIEDRIKQKLPWKFAGMDDHQSDQTTCNSRYNLILDELKALLLTLDEVGWFYYAWLICGRSMAEVGILTSSRKGGQKLTLNGYRYTRDMTRDTFVDWQCEDRACLGRVKEEGDSYRETKKHYHAPKFTSYCEYIIYYDN